MVIGIDEVGRGCWAGPLVAAAVYLGDDHGIVGLDDSKKLTKASRELLNLQIRQNAKAISIGWVEPSEVDRIGLTKSVELAMRSALESINYTGIDIIIDGNINYLKDIPRTVAVIKADGSVPAVSAASIVAKVARDNYMAEISSKYPGFGFESNVGYGTKLHIEALKKKGVTEIHRLTYKPVKAML